MKDVANYRTVFILSNFFDNIDKIIKTRLIFFSEDNTLLSEYQYYFRPVKNSIGALYRTTRFIYSKLDNNERLLRSV